ncbi:hypothetical protein ACFLU5_14705, partial [Bacteroidota bacterium]
MDHSFHIADLIVKRIKDTISPDEQMELEIWLNESDENLSIYNKATDSKHQLAKLEVYQLFKSEDAWSSLEEELFKTKTIRFNTRQFLRYAASILIPISITIAVAYYFLNKPAPVTLATIDKVITPGTQKAMLILSDGGTVELNKDMAVASVTGAGL